MWSVRVDLHQFASRPVWRLRGAMGWWGWYHRVHVSVVALVPDLHMQVAALICRLVHSVSHGWCSEWLCIDTFTAISCVCVRCSVTTRTDVITLITNLDSSHVSVTTAHQQIGCADSTFHVVASPARLRVHVLHMHRRVYMVDVH